MTIMKNESKNEKLAKSQNRELIWDAFLGYHQSNLRVQSKSVLVQSPQLWRGRRKAILIPFEGQGGGFLFAKGPPGCSHSPGAQTRCYPPGNKASPPIGEPPDINQIQLINKNQNSNQYKHLNLKIMKNQILFIVVFVLAAFAIVNKSYGQCTGSATSPAIGDAYNYKMAISGPSFTGTGTYVWHVTTSTDLISGAPIASGTEFTSTLTNANNIDVVWNAPALGGTFYLVVKYTEAIGGCDVSNMKSWEIKPINKFLLAIGIDPGTEGSGGSYCPADISSAIVTGTTAIYKYGVQTMYAEITASNFAGVWTPSFKITGMSGDQAIQNVVWGTTAAGAASATTDAGGGVFDATSNATAAYDGSLKIYLKFELVNNTWETLATQTISIAVDGVIPGASPTKDVVSDTDCTIEADFGKTHDQTIKPRPTGTGTPAFNL